MHQKDQQIRIGPVARIPRSHRGGRGSIPLCGVKYFTIQYQKYSKINK